jgi:hypothetical protein
MKKMTVQVRACVSHETATVGSYPATTQRLKTVASGNEADFKAD